MFAVKVINFVFCSNNLTLCFIISHFAKKSAIKSALIALDEMV